MAAEEFVEFLSDECPCCGARIDAQLREEVAELRAQNRWLLSILASPPGAGRLLADLHMQEPSAPTEGPHPNERPAT